MYAARLVVVLILVLTALVAYSPQAERAWQEIKPTVVVVIDQFYVAFRSFISLQDSNDRIDETPAPVPGGDIERIVTQNRGSAL
jgi:hypothetical protein